MSSVTPTGGGSSPSPIFSSVALPQGNSSNALTLTQFLDTFLSNPEAANFSIVLNNNPQLNSPTVSLSDYFLAVQSALRTSVQTQKEKDAEQPLTQRDLGIAIADTAAYLIQALNEITSAVNQYNALEAQIKNAINQVNQSIQQYNNSPSGNGQDQSQVNLLNQSITAYNQALAAYNQNPNAQNLANLNTAFANLQGAETTYNTYKAGRGNGPASEGQAYNNAIAQYQAEVTAFNAQIAVINNERAALGIPPLNLIPVQNFPAANTGGLPNSPPLGPTPPLSPVSTLSYSDPTNVQSVTFTPDPTESLNTFINTYFTPLVKAVQTWLAQISKSQKNFVNAYNLQTFFLPNSKNHYIANSYFSYVPPPSSSAAGAGGGATVGNMVTNIQPAQAVKALINGTVKQIHELSTQNQQVANSNVHAPSNLVDLATIFGLDILGKNALISVVPSLKLLANQLAKLGIDNSAVGASFSLAFANNLFALAGTNVVKQNFENFIGQTLGKAVSSRARAIG